MRQIPIKEVLIDQTRGLAIRPMERNYEFIYRDASGVGWSRELEALVAAEPLRWNVTDLFLQMRFAVRNEYGDDLTITAATIWSGINTEIKVKLIEKAQSG